MLLEDNKANYKRQVGDVFTHDSVQLARLIFNYFRNKGQQPDIGGLWSDDIRRKNPGSSFEQKKWENAWHNDGVTFKFKKTRKDDYPTGSFTLGIRDGYAIVKMHTWNEETQKRVIGKYKIPINKTVLELCQSLYKKYRIQMSGKVDKNDIYQANTNEGRFVKLLKSKGFDARFDENRSEYYIWTRDAKKIFPNERDLNILKVISSRDMTWNLALKDSQEDFIKVVGYIAQKYAKLGVAISTNDETKFWANSSEGASIEVTPNADKEEIQKGLDNLKEKFERLRTSENTITRKDMASSQMQRAIVKFFEDEYIQRKVIERI